MVWISPAPQYNSPGYTGANKREELSGRRLKWHIAAKRGTVKALKPGRYKKAVEHLEYLKAAMRAKVEYPFRVIKRQFGYTETRFRGLAKNTSQLLVLFGLSNLWMARRRLLVTRGARARRWQSLRATAGRKPRFTAEISADCAIATCEWGLVMRVGAYSDDP